MGRTGKYVFALLVGGALLAWSGRELYSYVVQAKTANVVRARARFSLQPCDVKGTSGALCGTYDVFEDRASRSGRKIGLNIVLLPSTGAHPAADPVFWLHGGPGAAATTTAQFLDRGFLGPLREDRDIVFVDQRGTGSSNGLFCDLGDDPEDPEFFRELFPPQLVKKCRETLEKKADLRQYTTPIAMDDLDEVRAALGYEKINLVAGSYGTIAAQVYLRQHAQHVRAAFLLGVASLAIKQPLLFARAAQHALELLFQDCASDSACHQAFPEFQKEFESVIARFEHGPVEAEVTDTGTGKPRKIVIARGNFVEYLRLMLYTTGGARSVPYLIHRAYLNDYAPFIHEATVTTLGALLARGMYLTVTCSEGVPFITDDDVLRESRGTFLGEYRVRAHQRACQDWVRGDIPNSYIEPVKSDVPVLMISGEADGSTPPSFGETVLKTLAHGRQVVVPHYGHQFNNVCVIGILKGFIEQGRAEGLDTKCVESVQRPPFVVEMPPARR